VNQNKTLWIVLTVVWILAGVGSAFLALMSVFMFDAPGSESSPLTIALFVCMVVLPGFWFLSAGIPWLLRTRTFATWFFLLPVVDLAAIVALFAAIEQVCGGMLACK